VRSESDYGLAAERAIATKPRSEFLALFTDEPINQTTNQSKDMTMPRTRRFMQVDVFTATPTRGNALAVVLDAGGLTDEQMQVFASWTNLAETTFVFPPDNVQADYTLRIFTPHREMPFAGHPTLGSCAAWLRAGGAPKKTGSVMQHCGVGLVEIDLNGEVPSFVAPPTVIDELP